MTRAWFGGRLALGLGCLVGLTGCLELVRRPLPETPQAPKAIQKEKAQVAGDSSAAGTALALSTVPDADQAETAGEELPLEPRPPRDRRAKDDARQINEYALWCIEHGMWDEARIHLERALAQDGQAASFHNNLGIIYERMGKNEAALAAYKRALALVPNKKQYAANLRRLEKRQQRASRGYEEEAEADSLTVDVLDDQLPLTEENEGGDTSQRTTP